MITTTRVETPGAGRALLAGACLPGRALPRWQCAKYLFAGLVMALAGSVLAHAETVRIDFTNETSLTFDYSLQLGQAHRLRKREDRVTFLGRASTAELSRHWPSSRPGQTSAEKTYTLEPHYADEVAFNMLTQNGEKWGMRSFTVLPGDMHVCSIPLASDGKLVHFILRQYEGGHLELREMPPVGSPCDFDITKGYGPSVTYPDQPYVWIQFQNHTSLSFDYSLQLRNGRNADPNIPEQVPFLGKPDTDRLTDTPIMFPGGQAPSVRYEIASSGGTAPDTLAFNMRTPDGRKWGLRTSSVFYGRQHTCDMESSWDGKIVLFVLKPRGSDGKDLELVEHLPQGDPCRFDVTPGYGPSYTEEPPEHVR